MDDVCAIMIKTIEEYNLMEKLKKNDQLKELKAEIYTMYKVIIDEQVEASARAK